jgi:putative ABC transport system permease protein
MRNIRLAFRTLFRTPFVTAVAIISLALGIGANAAIFSLFNQYLLRPLPVERPHELVNLANPGPKPGSQSCGNAGGCDTVFSYLMFRDLEQKQTVFTGIAAHRIFDANLAYHGHTAKGEGMLVSGSYFSVLGLRPAQGRLLDGTDDRAPGQSNVVVLSHAYWRQRFDANPAVLGEALIVNGQPLSIVGVTPEGFEGTTLGTRPRVYVPITMRTLMEPGFSGFDRRQTYWAYLFARLKPGMSIDQARTLMNQLYHGIINDVEAPLQKGMSEQTMARFKSKALVVAAGARGQSTVSTEAVAPLTILLCVTGVVLLSACANIANLLLARATRRSAEMAIRLSIGASRRHLIAQLLTESVTLAALGGLAGLLIANWTLRLIAALMPADDAGMIAFAIDARVLLFMAAITIGTGLLFGLFPALHSSRPNLVTTLKGLSGQPGGSRSAKWFRATLASAQIVMSVFLLAMAALFTRSLLNVGRIDLGLNPDNVVTFGIAPMLNGYKPEQSQALFERLEDELAAQPGVKAVTAAMIPLLAGSNWGTNVSVQGFAAGPDTDAHSNYNEVGPAYFATLGVPLLAGREFTRSDGQTAPKVAIVNEQFAKKFNLGTGSDVVGKRMEQGNAGKLDIEIVGLVKNAKYSEVKDEIPPLFYFPYRQDNRLGFITFYLRTAGDAEKLAGTLPALLARLDPNLPIENLRTLRQQIRENIVLDRLVTTLSAAFAGLATLLVAVGLYGVLAYMVTQRTREIGLRMALGAAPGRMRAMVLRQVMWMTIAGGAVGLLLAWMVGRQAESLLFEIKGHDPVALIAATVLLCLVAFAAGFIPAYRASRIDPMRALRYE